MTALRAEAGMGVEMGMGMAMTSLGGVSQVKTQSGNSEALRASGH